MFINIKRPVYNMKKIIFTMMFFEKLINKKDFFYKYKLPFKFIISI